MEYTEGKKVRPKSVWWRSLVLSVGSSLTAGSITRRCCSWGRNDAPSLFFFCMKRGTVTLLWNRVFDNSLFSSALSGKSSCQQFIQQHLYVSLSLTLCVYIYLIIVRTRHPSASFAWASFDMKTFLTRHSTTHPFSSALLTFSYDVFFLVVCIETSTFQEKEKKFRKEGNERKGAPWNGMRREVKTGMKSCCWRTARILGYRSIIFRPSWKWATMTAVT